MTNDELTSISNFIDAVNTLSYYEPIAFPLRREMLYRDGIVTITVDYGKLGKQMECWYWNELCENYKDYETYTRSKNDAIHTS